MNQKIDGKEKQDSWKTPQGIAMIVTAITGVIAAIGGIFVPIYLANLKPTATPELFSTPPVPTTTEIFAAISAPIDTITFTLSPTLAETATLTNTATFTPTFTHTPISTSTFTNTPTNTPAPRTKVITGKTLNIDLPSWVTDPVRGSITFNTDKEIASTRKLTVRLSIRNESGTKWSESTPVTLLELKSGERLCSISPAEYNSANYYLGLQSHCSFNLGCSYNIEGGKRLFATITNVNVIIAPQGAQCP